MTFETGVNQPPEKQQPIPGEAPPEAPAPPSPAEQKAALKGMESTSSAATITAEVTGEAITFGGTPSSPTDGVPAAPADKVSGILAAIKKESEAGDPTRGPVAVRRALESLQMEAPRGNAAEMGKRLIGTDQFNVIPYSKEAAQPGDILVRNPGPNALSNYGDIMVVTGKTNGEVQAAGSRVIPVVQEDGNRYQDSYLLRIKPKT